MGYMPTPYSLDMITVQRLDRGSSQRVCVCQYCIQWNCFSLLMDSIIIQCLHSPSGRMSYHKISSRRHEIRILTFPIALTFDRHIGSSVVEMPVKLYSVRIIITFNIAASRFGGKTFYCLVNRGSVLTPKHTAIPKSWFKLSSALLRKLPLLVVTSFWISMKSGGSLVVDRMFSRHGIRT